MNSFPFNGKKNSNLNCFPCYHLSFIVISNFEIFQYSLNDIIRIVILVIQNETKTTLKTEQNRN